MMFTFGCPYNIVLSLLALGYFLGSIPFGLIITKLAGYGDIRTTGSGNIGATNVSRQSKLLGALTLLFDAGKGMLAIYISSKFCEDYLLSIYAGSAAILGHIFPVWLKFRGGKGVATALAVFFMTNWIVGLFALITWICSFIVVRVSAVSALISFAITPLLTYLFTHDPRLIIANSLICALVIVRHKQNICCIIGEMGKK